MTFKCIKCGVHPLVFDGLDEYEVWSYNDALQKIKNLVQQVEGS